MRAANHASPNVYDFPVLCGWSVGALSKLPNVNNSAKLIGELDTSMQLGMPSDDFARQFPQWMLFNDSSEVEKSTPGRNLKHRHPHHQPYVTYDYTDREFQAHFLKVWKKSQRLPLLPRHQGRARHHARSAPVHAHHDLSNKRPP